MDRPDLFVIPTIPFTLLLHSNRHETSIFQHISAIVTSDDPAIRLGKPAPDIYLEAARRLGVPPELCMVVEDAVAGVQSGRAAHCGVVVAVPDARFTTKEKVELFGQHAHVVLNALDEWDGTPYGIPVNLNEGKEK
jgi:beta-phosphoglucomutase-like phosphatase (HAD superfamily)